MNYRMLAVLPLFVVGCVSGQPTLPTPNVAATVAVQVEATLAAIPKATPVPVAVATSTRLPTPTTAAVQTRIKLGDQTRLYTGNDDVPMADSLPQLEAFMTALVAKDDLGVARMQKTLHVFEQPSGTRVLVIQEGGALGHRAWNVRVLKDDGSPTFMTGWVTDGWLEAVSH